ncbi:MAG: DUF4011 domain-containing protein [Fibromonadaceae bacterium]|jgi:very-short-patch-repair endonuclease|nr:DUF4011 domain-containing protein [Fibromonadaceae bacterium]
MTININSKLEFWKNRLLDLGKRNRLISCPLPKSTGRVSRTSLLINQPNCIELWSLLAEREQTLVFPMPIEAETNTEVEEVFDKSFSNGVNTNQIPSEAYKTLYNLMRKSKEFTEEKGLNALYLAFGFLKWKENGKSDQELRSPLLLVPVKLTQEDLFSPIFLSRLDEEITTNYSLEQKLLNDFGVKLPTLTDDTNMSEYLSNVEQTAKSRGWSISTDVTQLSLFSFMKINMYRDLGKNAAKIVEHPLVKALNGESFENGIDTSGTERYNHDDVEPQETFSVVDADSSQQDAILHARRGVSFVLQGPPGTGKSQTITNIIAELIADGKKILFVSEKMAALEVVYKRLTQAGLADFCLTLHSHNTKRREILNQFEHSLKMSRHRAELQQDAFSKLYRLKETRSILNRYCKELHTKVEPLGKTIYQVNGFLAQLESYSNIDYVQTDAENFTSELLMQCEFTLEKLTQVVLESGYQQKNPWDGCVLSQITHEFRQQFIVDAQKLSSLIGEGISIFTETNQLLGIDKVWSFISIDDVEQLCKLSKRSPKVPSAWLSLDLHTIVADLDKCIKWQEKYNNLIASYDEDILSIDAISILKCYHSKYHSWLRFFAPEYRKIRKTLLSYCKNVNKLPYAKGLVLLDNVATVQTIDFGEISKRLSELLGTILNIDTDFAKLKLKIEWVIEFQSAIGQFLLGKNYISSICNCNNEIFVQFESNLSNLLAWQNKTKPILDKFTNLFDNDRKDTFYSISLKLLNEQLANCNFASLEYLIDYRNAEKKLSELGINAYLSKAKEINLKADEIVPVFKKCFFRSWLDAIEPRYTTVSEFRRFHQDERIDLFKSLDKSHIEISKAMLISKLISRLPNFDALGSSNGERNLLRREMAKQRKFMPIRKLIAALPNLLPVLKPCVMMSPLSISTYLGDSTFEFDTVVFDEASQVRTEEAVGAIFRGKQTIIAGDSKQLPPTDFFNSSMSSSNELEENEEGEIDDTGAFESLLDEATLFPIQKLLWHYRSRHEHLIAFSNAKIYHGDLITFPSAVEKLDGRGVEYIYVKGGIYDRGGKNGNKAEAAKVATLVFEHFHKYPNRSLGIIAFGEVQQSAIQDAIEEKRKANPIFEPFFKEDKEESLFIKNLETVQGDERDTIIFSIGYAPDSSGKFIMNFGPLSRNGGERRLNVAVTRARYNLKLVGSILPTDIDSERTSGEGPKLLRLYIDFALNGIDAILSEISTNNNLWFDSPFETSVYNFLIGKGFEVVTQVGCSGYRIDMAVRHPKYNGRFAIGIECDGAMYHSARTARERDRLRQAILENMGWKIYRVWSTDWIKDRHTEGERLLAAINQAIDNDYEAISTSQNLLNDATDFLKVTTVSVSESEQEGQQKLKELRSSYFKSQANEIPLENFVDTMLKVLSSYFGLNKEGLFKETALHGYGWERQGNVIKEKFEAAFNKLTQQGKIEIDKNGKIKLSIRKV